MSIVPSFPRKLSVELTNHCNQRCRYCPRQEFTRPLGFLDPGLFERIATEAGQHGARLWLHFLGEPLLHPEVVRLIGIAKALGVAEVGLSTNAVSLARFADALLDSGLDRLECSIDAGDRASYLALRGRDHFERVHAAVRAFLRRKAERGLRLPITSLQFLVAPEAGEAVETLARSWLDELGEGDFVMSIAPISFGGAVVPTAFVGAAPPGSEDTPTPRPPCRWLYESLVVLQDGDVVMCGTDWDAHAVLGNVRDRTIAEIWNGPEMRRRRELHERGAFASLEPCASCRDWPMADGRGYRNVLRDLGGRQ